MGELGDGRGHLEALVEDNLLALKADVLRPLDEAGQVGLRLNVLAYNTNELRFTKRKLMRHTNTEVLGASLEERVLSVLAGLAGEGGSSGLLSGLGGLGLVIETNISNMINGGQAVIVSVNSEL